MSEEIVEVIETKDRKALYFTPNRVIVAKLGGQAFTFLFGVFGALAESRMQSKKKEQLGKLSPESILTADKKNFAISFSEVDKVEMSKGFMGNRIRMIVGAKKHEFKLAKPKEFQEYVSTLQPIFGDKLVVS